MDNTKEIRKKPRRTTQSSDDTSNASTKDQKSHTDKLNCSKESTLNFIFYCRMKNNMI